MPTRISKPRSMSNQVGTWIDRLTSVLFRPRRALLDPRSLSDHLKRDMGFLDGNDPGAKGR